MMSIKNMILLSDMIPVYYNLRTVFAVLFIIFLIISVVYGKKIKVITIMAKKTGLHKRKEISLMKSGKKIKRKQIRAEDRNQYTIQMSMANQNDEGTTEKLNAEIEMEQNRYEETVVLASNSEKQEKNFYIIKSIVVVHGSPLFMEREAYTINN